MLIGSYIGVCSGVSVADPAGTGDCKIATYEKIEAGDLIQVKGSAEIMLVTWALYDDPGEYEIEMVRALNGRNNASFADGDFVYKVGHL